MNLRAKAKELYKRGEFQKALESLLAEKLNPAEDLELAYYLGLCYIHLRKYTQAITQLKILIERSTHLVWLYQARMLLAWLFIKTGEINQAERQLHCVLQEGYESAQAWSALAYCYWKLGEKNLAQDCYRSALKVDDGNATASNGLGFLLAEENPEESIKLCQEALNKAPSNYAYKDSLGWVLFKAGRSKEGIKYLVEALSLHPENPTIKQHLEILRTHEN